MDLEKIGRDAIQRAFDATKAADDAEVDQLAHLEAAARAAAIGRVAKYKEYIALGLADAARQLLYLQRKKMGVDVNDGLLVRYRTMADFLRHETEVLGIGTEKIKKFAHNADVFWTVLTAHAPLEFDGAPVDRGVFDKARWTNSWRASKYADPSTLELVLKPGFDEAFLEMLMETGKTITDLNSELKPPPKAVKGAVKARAPRRTKAAAEAEVVELKKELAAARAEHSAEVAAYKEEIKEKEADSEELVKHSQDTIGALKFELAEVKNELARVKDEIAREKDKNKAGRRQTAVSPLCDATNV